MAHRSYNRKEIEWSQGFTLLELIIALAIFSIISVPMFSFAISTANVTSAMSTSSNSYEQARIALDFVTSEIRAADDLAIKCNGIFNSYTPGMPYNGSLYMIKMRDTTTTEARSLRFMARNGGQAYNRMDYGGKGGSSFYYQELASDIEDITILINPTTSLMSITIKMLSNNTEYPLTLTKKISLKHKNIVDIEGI